MKCIFCTIIEGKLPSYKIYENEKVLALLDINPSANGHTLIIPKVHVAKVENLSWEDADALFRVLHILIKPIQKAMEASASTIGINNGKEAGQEVPHVHIHVIPRKAYDGGTIIQTIVKSSLSSRKQLIAIAEKIKKNIE